MQLGILEGLGGYGTHLTTIHYNNYRQYTYTLLLPCQRDKASLITGDFSGIEFYDLSETKK